MPSFPAKLSAFFRRHLCESCPHQEQKRIEDRHEARRRQLQEFHAAMCQWRNERLATALAKMIEVEVLINSRRLHD